MSVMINNSIKYVPFKLIDEISSTEIYIGENDINRDPTKPNWRITKIFKSGTTWYIVFPDGQQTYEYIWNDRLGYTYG